MRLADLATNDKLVPLTDPSTATMWCAVLELGEEEEVHDVPDAGEEGEEKEDMTTQEEEMKR